MHWLIQWCIRVYINVLNNNEDYMWRLNVCFSSYFRVEFQDAILMIYYMLLSSIFLNGIYCILCLAYFFTWNGITFTRSLLVMSIVSICVIKTTVADLCKHIHSDIWRYFIIPRTKSKIRNYSALYDGTYFNVPVLNIST